MVEVAKILLWGDAVGALSWDKNRNHGSFEFFSEFLNSRLDISPIHMPLANSNGKIYSFPLLNENTFKGLPGLMSDVLPDDFGNRLIDQWLLSNDIDKTNFSPVDRLCYIGKRGMGALEFEPSTHQYSSEASLLDISKLVVLAQNVMNDRNNIQLDLIESDGLAELIKVGTSAGGQRPKAIVAFNEETNEVRSGQSAKLPDGFNHYLFKFDAVSNQELGDPIGFGRIEYAYHKMALDCGIEMTKCKLYEENGRAHFMTRRFDRSGANEKIHMQTLCSLAHFDFKTAGAYSYESVFEVMRKLRLPFTQAEQLYRRMVFNVISRNQDDHTKNISFLMNKQGEWKLSPAYDVTYSFNPQGIWTNQHQMSVNGKRDDFIMQDLIKVGEGISLKKSRQIIEQAMDIVSQWPVYAVQAGIQAEQSRQLYKTFRMKLD
jgi:serine/threonine-protein kinase HipA